MANDRRLLPKSGDAFCSNGSLSSYRHRCHVSETGLWVLLRIVSCISITVAPTLRSPLFLQDGKVGTAHFGMLSTFVFNSSYTSPALLRWWHLEVFKVYFCTFSCLLEHIFPGLHLSPFISPTISIHNWQRKGTVMFSLAVFLPQSRCQQIATIDEPWCACTLLYISSRTVRDDRQLQTEHPAWIYSTTIHHLASCVRGGLLSSRSRIIIKINLLTFVWD